MKQLQGNKSDLIDRLLQHTLPEQPQITINALFPLPALICASPHPPRFPASQCQAVSSAIVSRWKNPPTPGAAEAPQGAPFLPTRQKRCGTGRACPGPKSQLPLLPSTAPGCARQAGASLCAKDLACRSSSMSERCHADHVCMQLYLTADTNLSDLPA